ncbi:MAG: ATP synthase subunit I [Nitrosomonas sp.]|uniref:ATP synthase subunit I n=1 Tax=Nitrosomonas sp. TaxID=42353 RepID=UPI0027310DA0|nr:ATP synthase subunit I [Nitrosomonas sp.]MDP1549670.1 ATP synthase subunit I [Nitrosomonas sp.]
MSWIKNRPLNIVLRLQLFVTLIAALVIWFFLSMHDAVSAVLGGAVSVISSAAFAIIISRHKGYTAEGTIRTALRAEAVKIILIVSMLWMVFNNYEDVNAFAFIGTFILNVLVYSMALFVSDDTK